MSWGTEAITVRYGDNVALRDATWRIEDGTISCVVGGDGAGKTTLLRALAGTKRIAAGSVDRPPKERIGYLNASSGVYRDLTVWENLGFTASAYGLRGTDFTRRANTMLDRIELGTVRDRLAGDLSGGMRQKLALGLAMLHDPDLLILDEPTTGVDPVSRAELWRLIAETAAVGTTVTASTTYLDEAERATSVAVLESGTILLDGSPDQIIAEMPGAVTVTDTRPRAENAWRRGRTWRVWHPDGAAQAAMPTLEDAVIVAELARETQPE